ncbi:hypothetical protein niasHT_005969 [Heterodera trifolii]|uniref:Uncharacterized protein n=1 Tax=Heterodera trifolii TaxID=157864 RepID=A0ABD2LX47_9BILA
MKSKKEKTVQLKLEVPQPPPLPKEFELKNVFDISPNPLRQKNCTKEGQNGDVQLQQQQQQQQQQYDDLEMQFIIQSTIGMLNEFEDENE